MTFDKSHVQFLVNFFIIYLPTSVKTLRKHYIGYVQSHNQVF